MRGILGWGAYLPHRRLDRTTIAAVAGTGGGKGTRAVASYDEDTTTMGVEAGRLARRMAPELEPAALWFATTAPAYLDKTNATTVHAALRLARAVPAYDAVGSVRSAIGALRAGLAGDGPALVVASDVRGGLPGGPDEAAGGDAAAAVLVGSDGDGPVVAEVVAWTSASEEFLDRWRTPGDTRSKVWEERFGETRYTALGVEAWESALKRADVDASAIDHLVVAGTHDRAVAFVVKQLGVPADRVVDSLATTVGNTGAAHPTLLLASALERATPGQTIAVLVLADGADAIVLRTTPALADRTAARPVAAQAAAGAPVAYGKYLTWRGMLPVEPPRRPEPARTSASAASRNADWKYGLVDATGRPMADATGRITTFTIDRMAYSPSPPVVFAVVDFEGGGRLPIELTDVDPSEVAIGAEVELTFRRLFTADGIHNYFWKGRLVQ